MMAQAKDIVDQIGELLQLDHQVRSFQLYCVRDADEIIIPDKQRMMDVLSGMSEEDQLLFAVCYYYPYDLRNPSALRLVFDQAVHDLHCGRYFRGDEDYFILAALALQERMQDYSGDNRILW